MEFILKNGFLMDPYNGLEGCKGDIHIRNDRIMKIGKIENCNDLPVIDLEGLTVTPGLVDFHAHFFGGGTNTSLEFNRYFCDGVTNAVDAGSAGDSNVESFLHMLSEKERRNVKIYLNLASEGLSCLGEHNENVNPRYFNEEKICDLCRQHSDIIIGLKLRISSDIVESSGTTSFEALRRGVEIADKCGLPLSVHMPDFQGELSELIDILRPGDVFCHVYTPKKGIIENGRVSYEMTRAIEKGIVLEAACGKGHFGHACAEAAIKEEIYPHIISGDFTRNTYHFRPAFSLPYLMSRFMALGIPFAQVLICCTAFPTEKMGMKGEIGCLKEGTRANIAVFKRKKGEYLFRDVNNKLIQGNELLIPMLTVYEGDIVYRNLDGVL